LDSGGIIVPDLPLSSKSLFSLGVGLLLFIDESNDEDLETKDSFN
jgi:hypothetical protein